MKAMKFSRALANAWKVESKKARFSEVQQFRALMNSFATLKPKFKVEEFHGMKHQVVFNGIGSWGRAPARCELSDLLIVSYKIADGFQARATLLQAKKSNDIHSDICKYWGITSASTSFSGNLEQWDLLSRRPDILPYPPFKCHPEILSGALLPSVGSIGVFHRIDGNNYDFFYLSADIATPIGSPKRKYAKLKTNKVDSLRDVGGYTERTFACCMITFGESLYNLEIGTPIHHESGLDPKDEHYRNTFRGWLSSLIGSHVETVNPDSVLAGQLMQHLQTDYSVGLIQEPPPMVLINCDEN